MPDIRKPQLIEATMVTIDEVGLLKANVATIAKHAGVSPAIINHYFGGKDGLLEATMRALLQKLSTAVKWRLAQAENTPEARIRAIIRGMFDTDQVSPKAVKTWLAFWSESMHRPELRRLQTINSRRLLSYLRHELVRWLPRPEAHRAAESLAALIDGLWLHQALSPGPIDTQHCEALIFRHLLAWTHATHGPTDDSD